MDKLKAIQVIEKYKSVSRLMGITEDEGILEEIIKLIDTDTVPKMSNSVEKEKGKKNYGEVDFQSIISDENTDIQNYEINPDIKLNKDKIVDYWYSIEHDKKNKFTIFELNIILFIISNQYVKYQKKDKKRIITLIDNVVKDKRMGDSYNNIIV